MKIATLDINLASENLILTNQRALFWTDKSTLIISDIHIGKTAHFRRHGIPIPHQILEKDLERLANLISHFKAKTVIVVGDLFHAENNTDIELFKQWLQSFKTLKWILVKGNHDWLSKSILKGLPFEVFTNYVVSPFRFIHDKQQKTTEAFTISGHIHPGVFIKGKGRQRIKLPCFQVTHNQLILPAFSLFTGLNTRDIPENTTCFAFTDEAVFEV